MSDKQRIAELEKELEEARIIAAQYQGRIIDKEHPMPDNPPKHMGEEQDDWLHSNWTDATWNPVVGCAGDRHFNGTVRCIDEALEIPLRWRRPRRVFVNSMSDLFHRDVPFEFIDKVFAVMALCPQHTFQILTKRPERTVEYLARQVDLERVAEEIATPNTVQRNGRTVGTFSHTAWGHYIAGGPLPNVWLGTSVENQQAADERIPHLLRCPAAVRFLSCEPLLEDVDLANAYDGQLFDMAMQDAFATGRINPDEVNVHTERDTGVTHSSHEEALPGIDWVIVGGESGPGARPCDIDWIRSIVQQCKAAGVPCFVKQIGARPRMNYYDCLRWFEERHWDSSDLRIFTSYGAEWSVERDGQPYVDAVAEFPNRRGDPKGSAPSEWPDDLRVRQWPEVKR